MRKMSEEQKAKMRAGKLAVSRGPKSTRVSPLKAIRQMCLDCCNLQPSVVKFCTLDGIHSTRCSLWPFRFGRRPESVARSKNARFIDPEQMPDANVAQEDCKDA